MKMKSIIRKMKINRIGKKGAKIFMTMKTDRVGSKIFETIKFRFSEITYKKLYHIVYILYIYHYILY